MPNQFTSPEGDLENYFVTEYWLIDQWVGDTLLVWGQGRLGNNVNDYRFTPVTTFAGGTNWKQTSSGRQHMSAIKTDGTLWAWGTESTNVGLIGDNTANSRVTPVTTFAGGTNWKQVSCGQYHTLAIKTDGTLWTWGQNYNGQLGNNTSSNIRTPITTFAGGTNWKQVAGGRRHTSAIKTDGTLWAWGANYPGFLGNNDGAGNNSLTPITTFAGGTNWKQVSCGYFHTAAIKTDGTLWTWGQNYYGQLGNNTSTNRSTPVTTFAGGTNWKQVDCGDNHTLAIKTDGTLWVWGRNDYGQLGNNTTIYRSTPVTTFAGGTNWKQVAGGGYYTAAIKTDGTLWTWGYNSEATLGDNTTNWKSTPVTTFAGGTNWKQVASGYFGTNAVTSGTDPTYFVS